MRISFTVPGAPVGKGRPRFTKQGHTYTPEKTASYENLVRLFYSERYREMRFVPDEPLAMLVRAYMPIPKSTSRCKAEMMKGNLLFPTKKPDCDNIAKIICDALNSIAYPDDKQLVSVLIEKRYSDNPRAEISVWNIQEDSHGGTANV